MFELKLLFGGLMVFVPVGDLPPAVDPPGAEMVWALMARADDPATVPCVDPQDPERSYLSHFPALRVPVKNLVGHRVPLLPDTHGRPEEPYVLVPISGESVEVLTNGGDDRGVRFEEGRTPGSIKPGDDSERRDFSWTPDLARAAPALAQACRRCTVGDASEADGRRLGARVKLTSGTLATEQIVLGILGGAPQPLLYNLKPTAGSCDAEDAYCQAVGQIAVLRRQELYGTVTLVLEKIGKPTSTPARHIVLQPAYEGDVIEVWVVNQTREALLKQLPNWMEPKVVDSFRWLQKLSSKWSPGLSVEAEKALCEQYPFPIPKFAELAPKGNPWCPYLLMQAFAG